MKQKEAAKHRSDVARKIERMKIALSYLIKEKEAVDEIIKNWDKKIDKKFNCEIILNDEKGLVFSLPITKKELNKLIKYDFEIRKKRIKDKLKKSMRS